MVVILVSLVLLLNLSTNNADSITVLTERIAHIEEVSSNRQNYLNRRIDLVDIAAGEATNMAHSAWDTADSTRTDKWDWMIGKTTDEITKIYLERKQK